MGRPAPASITTTQMVWLALLARSCFGAWAPPSAPNDGSVSHHTTLEAGSGRRAALSSRAGWVNMRARIRHGHRQHDATTMAAFFTSC
jgi:hypothetical protein